MTNKQRENKKHCLTLSLRSCDFNDKVENDLLLLFGHSLPPTWIRGPMTKIFKTSYQRKFYYIISSSSLPILQDNDTGF